MLESIFDGEGLILEAPVAIPCSEADVSTTSSGGTNGSNEDEPISAFLVQCALDIKPNTGMTETKIGLLAHLRLTFD